MPLEKNESKISTLERHIGPNIQPHYDKQNYLKPMSCIAYYLTDSTSQV